MSQFPSECLSVCIPTKFLCCDPNIEGAVTNFLGRCLGLDGTTLMNCTSGIE